jgi:hypothetical protein
MLGNYTKPARILVLGLFVFAILGSSVAMTEPLVSSQAIGHISNGSGNVETDASKMTLQGLLGRFSQDDIRPGNREVLAIAVALCDGGSIVNTNVSILPDIVSGTPAIAGGLAAYPCIGLGAGDGLHTAINGAFLTFMGPLAQYMGTVRMYADLDFDGVLFEGGDLVAQTVPMAQNNGEVLAQFGGQGQFLQTSNGFPLVAVDLPSLATAGGAPPPGFSLPRIILFTVDISSTATGGRVEVALGLGVGDDTAQGAFGFCPSSLLAAFPAIPPALLLNCGSNIRGGGPITAFFDIVGSGGGAIPPPPPPGGGGGPPPGPPPPSGGGSSLASYDTNSDCLLSNPEFFSLIDAWLGGSLADIVFFSGIDAWIGESNICSPAVSAGVQALTLDGVDLDLAVRSANFHAIGQGIESMEVDVFALNGERIFSQTASGSKLAWNMRSSDGSTISNGAYLYTVKVRAADGSILQSQVKSFALVR